MTISILNLSSFKWCSFINCKLVCIAGYFLKFSNMCPQKCPITYVGHIYDIIYIYMYTSRVTRLRPALLHIFSADMIFPTMLAPHRTTNPATTGILTQLSEDTGYLWCGLLGQTHHPAIRLALWPHFPGLSF